MRLHKAEACIKLSLHKACACTRLKLRQCLQKADATFPQQCMAHIPNQYMSQSSCQLAALLNSLFFDHMSPLSLQLLLLAALAASRNELHGSEAHREALYIKALTDDATEGAAACKWWQW